MFGDPYYHATIKKYTAVFGTLFNNIIIVRTDSTGAVTQRIHVPLAFGPAQKFMKRNEQDPELKRQKSLVVPRMSFELKNFKYDSERLLNPNHKNVFPRTDANNTVYLSQYNPAPYNFHYELNILTNTFEDGTNIVEQILPYFKPDFVLNVEDIPSLDLIKDIAIVFEDITFTDNYEGDYITRRDIIWTLNFTLKGYLYGKIYEPKIIKKAFTNVFLTPEMTANSNVFTYIVEPNPNTALANDDYTYTETFIERDV